MRLRYLDDLIQFFKKNPLFTISLTIKEERHTIQAKLIIANYNLEVVSTILSRIGMPAIPYIIYQVNPTIEVQSNTKNP